MSKNETSSDFLGLKNEYLILSIILIFEAIINFINIFSYGFSFDPPFSWIDILGTIAFFLSFLNLIVLPIFFLVLESFIRKIGLILNYSSKTKNFYILIVSVAVLSSMIHLFSTILCFYPILKEENISDYISNLYISFFSSIFFIICYCLSLYIFSILYHRLRKIDKMKTLPKTKARSFL